jgi:hypothetical protein
MAQTDYFADFATMDSSDRFVASAFVDGNKPPLILHAVRRHSITMAQLVTGDGTRISATLDDIEAACATVRRALDLWRAAT